MMSLRLLDLLVVAGFVMGLLILFGLGVLAFVGWVIRCF